MASLFHDQDRAAIQRIPRGGQDCPEPRDHMLRARVLESKQDDSRHPVVRESSDLAEIEVESEDIVPLATDHYPIHVRVRQNDRRSRRIRLQA